MESLNIKHSPNCQKVPPNIRNIFQLLKKCALHTARHNRNLKLDIPNLCLYRALIFISHITNYGGGRRNSAINQLEEGII